MDTSMFDSAHALYESGDWEQAYRAFADAYKKAGDTLQPGEVGYAAHMMGNCLMKLRRFPEAEQMYRAALSDEAYGKVGALNVNLGTALSAMKDYEGAIECFNAALSDEEYPTPYKALSALGDAELKLGNPAEAGVNYRNAALEASNPDPGRALVNLGVCFMALNRPSDAVESYVTALEFEKDPLSIDKIHANLGQAYVATGRMTEAVKSFEKALEDGRYSLSHAASIDYNRAKSSVESDNARDAGLDSFDSPYSTTSQEMPTQEISPQERVQQYQYDDYSVIPPADDTGFFTITEEEMDKRGRDDIRKARKERNVGPKIVLIVVIIVLALVVAGGVAFWKGYGYPTQEAIVQDLFSTNASGGDVMGLWASGDTASVNSVMNGVAKTDNVTVDSVERSMSESVAHVTATLPEGGQVHYDIYFQRDKISWKISDVVLVFNSQQ